MSRNDDVIKREPPPLPDKVKDFLKQRHLVAERTLNDQVEDIHLALYEDQTYRRYLRAVYDPQAVEGSLSADNIMAAMMIRERAKKMGYEEVADEKLAVISLSLGVVMRRYHEGRKERRNRVGDEIVPSDRSNDSND